MITDYLGLIPYPNQDKPNFMRWVEGVFVPLSDAKTLSEELENYFNLETATGAQLDTLGKIVGVSRTLTFTPSLEANFEWIVRQLLDYIGLDAPLGGGGFTVSLSETKYDLIVEDEEGQCLILSFEGYGLFLQEPILEGTYPDIPAILEAALTEETFIPSSVVDDEVYRVLIKSQILKNSFKGTKNEIYTFWKTFFPDYTISILDGQNMTYDVLVVIS